MKWLALCVSATLALACAPPGHAVEILHWQRLPLAVPLIVDQERIIFVDRNVRVGVPSAITDRLRVQSAGGAIYLRANAPIDPSRLQLQDTTNGALMLIDIEARAAPTDQPPLEPVKIVRDDPLTAPAEATTTAAASDVAADQPFATPTETPVPVALTRYAAQSLYAPLRTVEPVAGLSPAPLDGSLWLGSLLPTIPVRARALAAWRLADTWVTAIALSNTSTLPLTLDPRALQGDFVAATFQHPALGPRGDSTDTTVLYLVTRDHGLRDALPPAARPVDAAPARDSGRPAAVGGDPHEK